MGEFDCTVTPHYAGGVITGYCQDCPEVPAIAAVPAQTITDPRLGWNASAHSAVTREGNCYAQFSVPAHVKGVVVGFANQHRSSLPRDVDHAFYVFQAAGAEWWQVLERGVAKTAPVRRAPATDVFRLERRGSTVRYFFGGRALYTSSLASQGALQVVACLYSADDGVD